jgi:sugar phosphate isomerase/epimerase
MILCSSGVLFEAGRPHVESILHLGPDVAADGLEVLVVHDMVNALDEAAEKLLGSGMSFPAVHAPKLAGSLMPGDEGVRQVTGSARFARAIGADVVVLHLWDLPDSDTKFDERLDVATMAADIARDEGVVIAVETIPCLASTPLQNIERVLDHEPRLSIALDTEFLAYHGEIEATLTTDFLWERGVVRHIHIKDFTGSLVDENGKRRYHAPGEGDIDFPAFFDALEGHGYDGAVSIESALRRPGSRDVDLVNRSLARISRNPWSFT